MTLPPEAKFNRYYTYFHREITGHGLDDDYEPNIGSVYNYRIGLERRGRGQYYARHRGFGLGSFFSSLFHRATPFLRNLGTHAVSIVSNIAKDAVQGENIKESAIKHITKAVAPVVDNLLATKPQPPLSPQQPVSNNRKRKKTITASSIKQKTRRNNPSYSALNKI
jgi:hypothetical protein